MVLFRILQNKTDVSSQNEVLGTGDHAAIELLKELVQTSKITQFQVIKDTSVNKKNHLAGCPLI